jgi:hypothetical protein
MYDFQLIEQNGVVERNDCWLRRIYNFMEQNYS